MARLNIDSKNSRILLNRLTTKTICCVFAGLVSLSGVADGEQKETRDVEVDRLFQSRIDFHHASIDDLTKISQCSSSIAASTVSPQPNQSVESSQALSDRVQMLADSVPINSTEVTQLEGNVSIRDSRSLIRSHQIIVNHLEQSIQASGGVSFESSNAYLRAESLNKSQNADEAQLSDTQFYLFSNNANGNAKQVTVTADQKLVLQELSFSTCPVDQRSWYLSSSEMEIDSSEGVGRAWDTVIRVGDVPVFYLPYIRFPVDDRRKSGMLIPQPRSKDENGFDLTLPIYWNIAPHMDATFRPRFIENRGEQIGFEFRHLSSRTYSELDFEWMAEDKIVERQLADPLTAGSLTVDDSERWAGSFRNTSHFNEHWRANINAHRVSDSDYFLDFGSGLESTNATRLTSEIDLLYGDDIWQMRWYTLSYQSLIGNNAYRYLPSWTTNADYYASSGLRWQFSSEATRFTHKDSDKVEGERINILPSVSYPMRATWGYLLPKLSFQYSRYSQTDVLSGEDSSVTRDLPIFSVDSKLYFDRAFENDGQSYTHSLQPRLFYTYIPYRDQTDINVFDSGELDLNFNQLWRENRFSGVDRVGDTNHISLAVSNSLINNNSGEQLLDFAIGRKFYLDDRRVQLDNGAAETEAQSAWLAQLDIRLNNSLNVTSFIEWDEKNSQTKHAETRINFEPKDNHIVNLSHRYRNRGNERVEELDLSFAWSINEQWRFVGRWYNDITQHNLIDAMAGLEYESCCWAIRLVSHKYLNTQLDNMGQPILIGRDEYSDEIQLQFVFKGFGSVGASSVERVLTSSIPGYKDPFGDNN